MTVPVTVAYTPEYLDWRLGAGHPTNPERARLAVEQIRDWAAAEDVEVRWQTPTLDLDRVFGEAPQVHNARYLAELAAGRCDEWSGTDRRLRDVAALMFTGTLDLVEDLLRDWRPGIWFNPQGAKHHAHADRSSGFCVLNDMAYAATRLTADGKRVLYVDWDAHHGDGVEALLLDNPRAVTASIHDRTIFPGTGRGSRPDLGAYNWPLAHGAGDADLAEAIGEVLDLAEQEAPDVLLLACGADGLAGDPLSSLTYTLEGIGAAAARIGAWTAERGLPVVVGGAGGYQPLTETPAAWALTVTTLYQAHAGAFHQSPAG